MTVSGPHVREERERRGWTQKRLGQRLGLSQNTVSDIESSAVVGRKYLPKLDKAFGGAGWRSGAASSVAEERMPYGALGERVWSLERQLDDLQTRMANLTRLVEQLAHVERGKLPDT